MKYVYSSEMAVKMILCREIQHTHLSAPFANEKARKCQCFEALRDMEVTPPAHLCYPTCNISSCFFFPWWGSHLICVMFHYPADVKGIVSELCLSLWLPKMEFVSPDLSHQEVNYCLLTKALCSCCSFVLSSHRSPSHPHLRGRRAEGNRMVLSWKCSSIPVCFWRRWDDCFGNAG